MQTQQNSHLHFLHVMWLVGKEAQPVSGSASRTEQRGGRKEHALAAAVLLDGALALGALLGVGADPIGRLRVVGALLPPELGDLADDRPVVGRVAAAKAERLAAGADDRRDDGRQLLGRRLLALDRKLACGKEGVSVPEGREVARDIRAGGADAHSGPGHQRRTGLSST
jgi:hypothetical protein